MKKTYLEFRGAGSSKFWEISVEGSQHTVRFGKIGTDGRSQTKSFKTPALASKDAEALTSAKLKKGYAPAKGVAAKAQTKLKPVTSKASAKHTRTRDMAVIVEEVIASMTAAFPDVRPKRRKPATKEQIAALEASWKRPLPPSYRAFLETTNGIAGDVSHRLVGTEDQKWAARQLNDITEYWKKQFDPAKMRPVAVPLADDGILNFAAFDVTKKGDELPVVDWDTEREHGRFKSFEAYLEGEIETSLRIAKENAKKSSPKPPNGKGAAKALVGGKAIPKSGPERAEAFEAIFQLKEVPEIERAIERLVAAKPSPAEIDDYFATAEDGIFDAALKNRHLAYARASFLFHPELKGSKTFYKAQLELATIQLEYVTGFDPKMAARWADAVRVHVAKNPDLGRQLASTYALAGRVDDAIAMVEAAIKAGYEDAPHNPMRTDKTLSSLFKDPRVQDLFGPTKPVKKK